MNEISLDTLAKTICVTKYHFCRLFKEITGETPTEYINKLRINKAAELLKNEDINVTEVGLFVGFPDANYFCKLFKKYKKISPTAYRNKLNE